MSMLDRLKNRWNVGSALQVVLILITFALTGTTVVYIAKPLLAMLFGDIVPIWARIAYYILILPVYNLFLLMFGFLLGQFRFFWNFEKRLFTRLSRLTGKEKT